MAIQAEELFTGVPGEGAPVFWVARMLFRLETFDR